jgi:hypothetical protein
LQSGLANCKAWGRNERRDDVSLVELEGQVHTVNLQPHHAIVNPPGVWHTADVSGAVTALFITAGMGTEHRPC